MRAGLLREQIEIYRPQLVKDEYGEECTTYVQKCKTRARLIHRGGDKIIDNEEVIYTHRKLLQIRHYVDIREFDRITYNEIWYEVKNIERVDEQMMIEIIIEQINE